MNEMIANDDNLLGNNEAWLIFYVNQSQHNLEQR